MFAEQAAAPAAASQNHSIVRASGQSSTLSQPHMLYMYSVCMVTAHCLPETAHMKKLGRRCLMCTNET